MKKLFYIICGSSVLAAFLTTAAGHVTVVLILLKAMMALLALMSLYFGLRVEQRFFSPFTLFCTYPIAILLYSDYISGKYLPMPSLNGAMVLMGAGYAVFAGMWAMRWIGGSKVRDLPEITENNYATWPMFLLFLIPMLMLLVNVDIDTLDFSSKTGIREIRSQSGIVILGSLSTLYAACVLNAVRKRQNAMVIFIFIILLGFSLLNMSRGSIFNFILALVFALETYRRDFMRNVRVTKLMLYVVVLLVVLTKVFSFYGELRSGSFSADEYMESYEYARRYHDISELPKPLQNFFSPYMYIVTPSSNVLYLVENRLNDGDGTMVLWPLISTFQLKRLFDLSLGVMPNRIDPYNTFSIGGAFYYDGGWPLVLVGCFLIGFVTYWFYLRACFYRDVLVYAEYFYWGLALFYGFFSNHFLTQAYPLRVLIIFELYRILCRNINSPLPVTLSDKRC